MANCSVLEFNFSRSSSTIIFFFDFLMPGFLRQLPSAAHRPPVSLYKRGSYRAILVMRD